MQIHKDLKFIQPSFNQLNFCSLWLFYKTITYKLVNNFYIKQDNNIQKQIFHYIC